MFEKSKAFRHQLFIYKCPSIFTEKITPKINKTAFSSRLKDTLHKILKPTFWGVKWIPTDKLTIKIK